MIDWQVATPKLQRLTSATDFERVRRDGRSHAHPLVVLVARRRSLEEANSPAEPAALPAARPPTRVGFTAGRSVGSAVARNRAKRLLREAVRARQAALAPGWDLVLIARKPLAEVKLPEAQAAVDQLLQRARVVSDVVAGDAS